MCCSHYWLLDGLWNHCTTLLQLSLGLYTVWHTCSALERSKCLLASLHLSQICLIRNIYVWIGVVGKQLLKCLNRDLGLLVGFNSSLPNLLGTERLCCCWGGDGKNCVLETVPMSKTMCAYWNREYNNKYLRSSEIQISLLKELLAYACDYMSRCISTYQSLNKGWGQ